MVWRPKVDKPGIPPNIPTPVPGGNAWTPQKHEQEHSPLLPLPLARDPACVAAGGAARFAGGGAETGGTAAGGAEAGGGGETAV